MLRLLLPALLLHVQLGSSQREGERCVDSYTNGIGICRKVTVCQSARENYQLNGIEPTFCSLTTDVPVVCCRDGATILQTPAPSDYRPLQNNPPSWGQQGFSGSNTGQQGSGSGGRTSERLCQNYSAGVMENLDFITLVTDPEIMSVSVAKCEYDNTALILGGRDADLGEFPHMAALGWPRATGGYSIKCGGSLISDRFVLTAGHCLKVGRDPSVTSAEPTVVFLGEHNINPDVYDGASPIEVSILRRIKHPAYNPPNRYNDIGLVELRSPVTPFTSKIRPACLWSRRQSPGGKAIATGWGVVNLKTNRGSDVLQKVSLDLMENSVCDPLLKNLRNRHWRGFQQTQLCAGVLSGGKDSCQGDSGGPLQVVSTDNHCVFHIVGVTSFGGACAAHNQPAIYTRVSEYLDWIESVVWPRG